MDNTKLNFTVINLLATAQLFHEELDELENTPYFKHSLKKAAKNIELELTKTLDDHIAHLWKIDEKAMQEIQLNIKTIIKELVSMDPMKINDVSNYINQNKKT
tara:strand:+ start:256 stop:564 length:309 start_codon:yes stop_codon:yes gene_type:complete